MKHTLARPADDLEQVMETYGNMLFRICLVMLGNGSDAEDALQEVFIKYYSKAPAFTVAAAVALCLGLGSVTALAATGKLEGFFADVTRWDGAVVGETYEQATEEIEVTAYAEEDVLVVEAVLLKANEAPYFVIENWGIGKYSIQDADGEVVAEGSTAALFGAAEGKINMEISVAELEAGSYTLIITEFTGSAKAEQDLPVKGYWECEFRF